MKHIKLFESFLNEEVKLDASHEFWLEEIAALISKEAKLTMHDSKRIIDLQPNIVAQAWKDKKSPEETNKMIQDKFKKDKKYRNKIK